MSSTEVRTSRMPEIENIALREALKDLGLEPSSGDDDFLVRVVKGPEGYSIAEVLPSGAKTTPSRLGRWSVPKYRRTAESIGVGTPDDDARDEKSAGFILSALIAEADKDLSNEETGMMRNVVSDEALEFMCRHEPEKLLDIGLASLERTNAMMAEIVEETRRDLIEIAIRRERIDRTQAETREILKHLFEDDSQ